MMTNELFQQCLDAIPEDQKASFELSYNVAARLDMLLKSKNMTRHELARRLGKRDSEISKWLTGRHNFTLNTIASIESVIGDRLIKTL